MKFSTKNKTSPPEADPPLAENNIVVTVVFMSVPLVPDTKGTDIGLFFQNYTIDTRRTFC